MTKCWNFRFPFVFLAVIFAVPASGTADETEGRKSVTRESHAAEGILPRRAFQVNSEGQYVSPRLPENVIAANRPAVMPRNEKIRILPLNTLKVPAAVVLAKPIQKSVVFNAPQIARPATSPVETVAAPAPAIVPKRQS